MANVDGFGPFLGAAGAGVMFGVETGMFSVSVW